MFADLDLSIKELLTKEMPINNGEIVISFDQPTREWSSRLSRPTLNFYLYDIKENHLLRQHQWRTMNGKGSMESRLVERKRTPFRLDCHYMITAWTSEEEDAHRLLSHCMHTLFRFPSIPDEYLLNQLSEQPFQIQTVLAQHDKLTNPSEIWGALNNELRPSISYVVTAALDPWTPISTPLVFTGITRLGQADDTMSSLKQGTITNSISFAGKIIADEIALPDIQVALKGTGFFTTTDQNGQFLFLNVPEGAYDLVVWQDDQIQQFPIVVPSSNYTIMLNKQS